MLRYLPSSTQKTHSSQFLLFPPTHKARFSSWFEFFTSPSVTEQHPGPQITAKPGIFTVHLHQQLRLDSATGLVLVRRASAAADGIYFIYEDCCRSVKPRLDSNESTAVKTEAASTGPSHDEEEHDAVQAEIPQRWLPRLSQENNSKPLIYKLLKLLHFKLCLSSQRSFSVGWFSSETSIEKGKRNTSTVQAGFF